MTTLSPWTAADFADSFQRHLPTGPVWPRDPDTTQRAAIEALMPTYERSWGLACDIPAQTLPSSATFLLPEWESSLGLPDPCAGPDQTIAQRQAHVVARLTQQNGPSIPSLTAFAAGLGYTITITEYAPARFGATGFGKPYGNADWAFAWTANAPATQVFYAQFGETYFGEPYSTWGSAVLECELNRMKQAHTILIFAYSGPTAAALWGQGIWGRDSWA